MAHESAAIRVASELRSEILQGDIAPGARLSQQSTAERFGVSRIPVRDALQVLAGEGLVHPTSNATAVVTGMRSTMLSAGVPISCPANDTA